METSQLVGILEALLVKTPLFLVWLAGAIVALVRAEVPRRVAAYLVGGLVVLLLVSIAGTLVSMTLPVSLMRSGHTAAETRTYLTVWGIFSNLVDAAAWIPILLAVFVDRRAART